MNSTQPTPHRTAVSLPDIVKKVKRTTYTVLPDGKTTICQLHMENGYTINGQSSCVDPSKYNRALGEKYAYEDAIDKAWPLEGYLLAEELFRRAPVRREYLFSDVARHHLLTDPLTGVVKFHVKMLDGAVFEGQVSPGFNDDQRKVQQLVMDEVNRMAAGEVRA